MWIVIKFEKKYLHSLFSDIKNKIDSTVEFYLPKLEIENNFNNKLIKKEIFLLGDYVFCFHKSFSDFNKTKVIKNSKGLKYILNYYHFDQKKIIEFLNYCKLKENDKGYIDNSFFEIEKRRNYIFLNGPFSNIIFRVLEKNRKNLKIIINKVKLTIPRNKYFLQVT